MKSFTTPLIVSPLLDGRTWRLYRSFTYRYKSCAGLVNINIPAGFSTDFASVPRIFWTIISPWGKFGKAAVLHDYLYRNHQVKIAKQISLSFSRKEVDTIFLYTMRHCGTSPVKAKIMYWAVRVFGRWSWKKGDGQKKCAGQPVLWDRNKDIPK